MSLPATFLEGFEAVWQPCTLPLLLSAFIFIVAAGQAAPLAALAHLGGVTLMAWARFAQLFTIDISGSNAVIAGAIVAAAALGVAIGLRATRWAVIAGAAVGGAVAAALWRPCVGPHLADVINGAPDQGLSSLVPTAAYATGIALLSLAIAAVPLAFPRMGKVAGRPLVTGVGVGLGVTLGLLIAIGVWNAVVDELLRMSTV